MQAGPRHYDRRAREAALVEAAAAVFAEVGYEAATTRLVGQRAECSEGLIHTYFGGKEGLLRAVLAQRAGRASRQPAPAVVADLSLDLSAMMRFSIAMLHRERRFLRVAFSRALVDDKAAKLLDAELHERRAKAFAERLKIHDAAGRIGEGHDLKLVAASLATVAYGAGFVGREVLGHSRRRAIAHATAATRLVARSLAI